MWKDVDGVLTCDPNIYPLAEPVPYLTFEEAAELAYFGAQVFYVLKPFIELQQNTRACVKLIMFHGCVLEFEVFSLKLNRTRELLLMKELQV